MCWCGTVSSTYCDVKKKCRVQNSTHLWLPFVQKYIHTETSTAMHWASKWLPLAMARRLYTPHGNHCCFWVYKEHEIPLFIFLNLIDRDTDSHVLKGRPSRWWETTLPQTVCWAHEGPFRVSAGRKSLQICGPDEKWPVSWGDLGFPSQDSCFSQKDWTVRPIKKENQSHFTHRENLQG